MSGADLAKDKEKADRTDEATVKASGPDKAGTEAAAKPAENPTIRQPSSERVLLARLFRYVRPHWRVFALGVVAMMLTGSTETALPAIMQHLLDDGFGGKGNPQLMWTAPLMIIGLFVGRGMFTFTMNYAMNEVSNSVLYDLRKQMFDRLVQMPVSYFSTHSAGTIIARLVNDVQNVTQSLASVLVIMVRDTCVILGLLGWLLYLNWQLTMIAFVLIPMVALAVGAFSRRMRRLSGEQLRYTGELTSVVGEAIHGNPVIKVYAGQEHERSRFAAASRQLQGFARRMTVASSLLVPITQVMAAVAVSLVSEYAPPKVRGRFIVLLESFWGLGWLAAALASYFLIPRYGWASAFALGALPLPYALWVRTRLPESVPYLLGRGRVQEAHEIVCRMEAAAGRQPESPLAAFRLLLRPAPAF